MTNGEEYVNPIQESTSIKDSFTVDLRTIDFNRPAFITCQVCGHPLVIYSDKETCCPNCGSTAKRTF